MASTVPEIVKQRINALNSVSAGDQVALANLINGLIDGIRAVTAILDADAGVTATTTTETFDAVVTK